MVAPTHPNPSGIIARTRVDFVPGGAAGTHTLTGISTDDRIISVKHLTLTLTEGTPNTTNAWTQADLTTEFTGLANKGISAADTIDNTGGTATTNDLLVVTWYDHDWGFGSDI